MDSAGGQALGRLNIPQHSDLLGVDYALLYAPFGPSDLDDNPAPPPLGESHPHHNRATTQNRFLDHSSRPSLGHS